MRGEIRSVNYVCVICGPKIDFGDPEAKKGIQNFQAWIENIIFHIGVQHTGHKIGVLNDWLFPNYVKEK